MQGKLFVKCDVTISHHTHAFVNLVHRSERDVNKPILYGFRCDACHASVEGRSKSWKYEQNRKFKLKGEIFVKAHPLLEGKGDIHDTGTIAAMNKIINTGNHFLSDFGIRMRRRVGYLAKCQEKSIPNGAVEANSFL